MTPKLTAEQREAIDRSEGPVAIEDEQTHRRYFLVDEAMFSALRQQDDIAAIREGIADMEAGRVAPLAEVIARIRRNLSLNEG
jgi:predicted transcriptional regulator